MSGVSDLTADERAVRDARIVSAARAGESRQVIAVREGLTDRQVRRIVSRQPSRGTVAVPELEVAEVLTIDPLGELGRAIALHRDAIDRLRAIAVRSQNESVAVGALKGAAAAARELLGLLRDAGLTPPAAFDWRGELQWRRAWEALGEVAGELGLDEAAVTAAFHRRFERRRDVELVGLGPSSDLEAAA